jgi:hypothetical protein
MNDEMRAPHCGRRVVDMSVMMGSLARTSLEVFGFEIDCAAHRVSTRLSAISRASRCCEMFIGRHTGLGRGGFEHHRQ